MKGKLFTLTLLLLVSAGAANSQVTNLLPATTPNVDASSGNVTANKALARCFNLSGRILGDAASTPDFVMAVTCI